MCNTILMGVEVEMGLWEGLCVDCGCVLGRLSACGLPHAYVVGSTRHPRAVSDPAHGGELHAYVHATYACRSVGWVDAHMMYGHYTCQYGACRSCRVLCVGVGLCMCPHGRL